MEKNNLALVRELRSLCRAGVSDCQKALEKANGDIKKALAILRQQGQEIAAKKSERETGEGAVVAYVHANQKIGAMVALLCETDFVARTEEFKKLAYELAMQVAAMAPVSVEELLTQEYIRDPQIKVGELIAQTAGEIGENIQVREFVRLEV
ncbi:translation elongation factor Ts [Candidatus Shapirobacteria bacterium]|nr:translation elongation factor Ts [Candidatus Shapirobacteria bacterium]